MNGNRRALALFAVLGLLWLLPVAALGVEEPPAQLRIEGVDVSDHPRVGFTVSVPLGAEGALTDEAFTVTEDGVERPAEVRFTSSDDLRVLLLIDTTGSMSGRPLAGAKAAATAFVEDLPDDVPIAVMNYDTTAELLTPLSTDQTAHLAAIDGLVAGGYTATYDAVLAAVEVLSGDDPDATPVLVLLTDGEDNSSTSTLDDAVEALTGAGVVLYGIEYLTDSGDAGAIRRMATASGGSVLQAGDDAALARIYEGLAADLVSRYQVSYLSEVSGVVDLTVSVDSAAGTLRGSQEIELPAPPPSSPDDEVEEVVAPVPPDDRPAPSRGVGAAFLVAGGALWFAALAVTLLLLLAPRERPSQLAGARVRNRAAMAGVAERASAFVDRRLERKDRRGRLDGALERAGIELRAGEFVVLVTSAAVTALALGRLLSGWLTGLALVLVVVVATRVVLSTLTQRRQARFEDQLGETLQLLSGSLRAGYSLMQAVDSVAREAPEPTAQEFGRVVVETRLGRGMDESLQAMGERMRSNDFRWVVQAIEIHREVGGDLAEVLDTVATTIRERNQIRRQVKALSAEGRLSAYVLLALPFGVGFFIYLTNRPYLAELTNGGRLGWSLLGIGGVLMVVGVVWMRKLVRIDV